ncbi:MAG: cysteine hydrolase [Candidatus Dormibacter sp.]|uniref:cysteine hydrolase n=1 Tax=Candidatus Dormibacter sp. TaxID=2973982 RepID=UPI003D9AF983
MNDGQAPAPVDRSQMTAALNAGLALVPARTAVVTIDCHRGHLDPEVATMPVAPEVARAVVASVARLLETARAAGMPVLHVILQNRVLPDGTSEPMRNPFWAAVEGARQQLTPELESTISRHNIVGSLQTQLMPELGPAAGDIVINTKRRLSIYRDTDLELTLHELGVDTVVLVGVNTNTCVMCAAFESLNRDLRTIVVAEGVHSMYGDDLHHFGLQNIARCLGWVLSLQEFEQKVEAARTAFVAG